MNNSKSIEIKRAVTGRVCQIAQEADWKHLTINQRTRYYESWSADPNIGGELLKVMEPEKIRVYIKDTIIKSFLKNQRADIRKLFEFMAITYEQVSKEYIKPEALLCNETELYTLTVAKEWKTAIMSAFERGYEVKILNRNCVFIIEHTTGRFVDQSYRELIAVAAQKLGIDIHWIT